MAHYTTPKPESAQASPVFIEDILPTDAVKWMYAAYWVTITPGYTGVADALIFDGGEKPLVLHRGVPALATYDQYIGLVAGGYIPAHPEVPFTYVPSRYPTLTLRFRKRKNKPTAGFVYVIGNGHGAFKIGRAGNVSRRLTQLQCATNEALCLEHSIMTQDSLNAERYLHHVFSTNRLNGEWFTLTNEQIAWVKTLTDIDGRLK